MLAAEINRTDTECDSSFESKVRSGSSALAALTLSDSPADSVSTSTVTLSPPVVIHRGLLPSSSPVDISGRSSLTNGGAGPLLRPGSSGRLSFLSCFSSSALATLDDDEQVSSSACECEVGIRPSFYWVDGTTTEEQRAEAEDTLRFFKADCQDEARVIQNFGGLQGLTFVGVFDGHGPHGRSAAKFASDRLPEALAAQTVALQSRSEKKRLKAMREACRVVNTAMQDHRQAGFDASLSGTTACFALVVASQRGTRVLLANVGDSRCVLARRTNSSSSGEPSTSTAAGASGGGNSDGVEAVDLTIDAKPSLPTESRRIIACGGVVKRLQDEQGRRQGPHRVFRRGDDVLPGLAMSRSLGDTYAHGVGVTWEPTLSAYSLSARDLFLVLGTDGVWDVMNGDAAVDFVERYRCKRVPGVSCAEALTLEAQERWKAAHDEAIVDDISVAILHFAPMPPLPEQERTLPRTLSRAASNNDEANALASAWLKESSDANPSIRSPRPIFQYLYRTSRGTGSGDFWDSLPREAPGSPFKLAAAEAEAAAVAASAAGTASTSAATTPSVAAAGIDEIAIASLPLNSSSESISDTNAATATVPIVPPPRAIPVPTPARTINTRVSPLSTPPAGVVLSDHPVEHAVHGGHSLRTNHSFSLATMHESSPVIDIPHLSAAAATGGAASSLSSRPIPMAGRNNLGMACSAPAAPGVLSSSQEAWLRPIRKAYPSQATMVSVPSWDGAFHNSFLSDSSLPLVTGAETPRSSESEPSTRPRRHEGRHEGKVRRGIPCSYSSTGMASFGRQSTDSEGPSLTTSQIGSLDELGTLAGCLLASTGAGGNNVSPRPVRAAAAVSGHGGGGTFGRTVSVPLSPSRRGLPRPSSHGALLSAMSEMGGAGYGSGVGIGGPYRTASGRVNIIRPIEVASSVPSASSGTLS